MLVHLSVRDLAIIDVLELSLDSGMTALTGETGAGKSILIDAISLLLGARARGDMIRTGADEAEVAGQFALHDDRLAEAQRRLDALGLPPCEEGALVVRRIVSRAGRHKQFINGALATVAQLRELMELLIDITGQHANQLLVRTGAQLDMLDAFGGHRTARARVRERYTAARALVDEQSQLQGSEEEKLRQAEYLRFQVEEIDAIEPREGEDDALAEERARLMNASKLRDACAAALEALVEGGEDALSRVQSAAQSLARAGHHDADFSKLSDALQEAVAIIDDVSRTLGRRRDLEDDPERLAAVDDRLDSLKRIMRKHGGSVAQVLAARDAMQRELDRIEHAEERLAELERELAAATARLAEACTELSGQRKEAALRFAARVEHELKDLGMAKAHFSLRVEPLPAQAESALSAGPAHARYALGPHGADRVEMFLAANPGEEAAPLARAASGGELSRILLAIKRVLLEHDPIPVTIFDEVDAGVGGAVGEAIGDKLRAVAVGRQVLVVTHLAQIAAQAHTHLRVEKEVVEGRTLSRIRPLVAQDRVEEIARMLGGRELTEATRRHAAEMLERVRATADLAAAPASPGAASAASPTLPPAARRARAATPAGSAEAS